MNGRPGTGLPGPRSTPTFGDHQAALILELRRELIDTRRNLAYARRAREQWKLRYKALAAAPPMSRVRVPRLRAVDGRATNGRADGLRDGNGRYARQDVAA